MGNPKITVELTTKGIEVDLQNWVGVNAVKLEHIHFAIIKASQVYKAGELQKVHKAKMAKDAKKLEEKVISANPNANDESFIGGLGNALKQMVTS